MSEQPAAGHRCGFAAIVGRPNVGKSTLLNALLGQKISIVSPKPQTTRHRILGILTRPTAQVIFVDTPGLHAGARRAMNRHMNRAALASLQDADVNLFVVEALNWTDEDQRVLDELVKQGRPIVLVLNKTDKVFPKERLLPFIEEMGRRATFAEIVREKLTLRLRQELPYGVTVLIEQFKEEEGRLLVNAVIWVERSGQKAIVIGNGGEQLKDVGRAARLEMNERFKRPVHLELWVKVKDNWSDNETALRQLGYE